MTSSSSTGTRRSSPTPGGAVPPPATERTSQQPSKVRVLQKLSGVPGPSPGRPGHAANAQPCPGHHGVPSTNRCQGPTAVPGPGEFLPLICALSSSHTQAVDRRPCWLAQAPGVDSQNPGGIQRIKNSHCHCCHRSPICPRHTQLHGADSDELESEAVCEVDQVEV